MAAGAVPAGGSEGGIVRDWAVGVVGSAAAVGSAEGGWVAMRCGWAGRFFLFAGEAADLREAL